MVVLKDSESCRMTHAKFWKGKHKHLSIIFQPELFGIILILWSLLLREGLRCPSQQVTKDLHTGLWVSGCVGVCGCVGVYVGSMYLGCVSGGVATVISLGI